MSRSHIVNRLCNPLTRAREIASAGTGMAPGLCQAVGGRPKAIPCLKLFSFLYPKSDLPATIEMGDAKETYEIDATGGSIEKVVRSPESKFEGNLKEGGNTLALGDLAYARSGDKGTTG